MKKIILTAHFFICVILLQAQTKNFPQLTCTNVEDKKVILPDTSIKKKSVYVMMFSKKAESALTTWMMPLYQDFVQKEEGNQQPALFEEEGYDVQLEMIFVLNGAKQLAEAELKKELKNNMQPEFLNHILIYTGAFSNHKKDLQIVNEDIPYFFVVDSEGQIIYQTSGAYTEDKWIVMEQTLNEE
jgi:hypothetical protein